MAFNDIPQIVKDLKHAPYEAKEKHVHLMDIVATQQQKNPGALVAAGAVKPLVDLISNGNDGAQLYSASTLATIAAANSEYQLKIIEAGGIAPLVTLLRMGSNKAQENAAYALAELSEQRAQQDPIIKAGIVVPLVRLLRGDVTENAHLHAADAVANLSVQNPKAQRAFYEAGAVPLLLAQLHSGKSQTSVANALAKLLSPSAELGAPANIEIQTEIANDEGVAPLLALLSGMSTGAQVHAAEALSNLARGNESTQKIIAKAGGIPSLLAMLAIKSTDAQAQGSSALAQLTRHNRENQDSFAKAGGMVQLVALLSSSSLQVQAMAALALSEVCRDNSNNQTEAADLGCISSLVDQLKATSTSSSEREVREIGWFSCPPFALLRAQCCHALDFFTYALLLILLLPYPQSTPPLQAPPPPSSPSSLAGCHAPRPPAMPVQPTTHHMGPNCIDRRLRKSKRRPSVRSGYSPRIMMPIRVPLHEWVGFNRPSQYWPVARHELKSTRHLPSWH